MPIGTIHVVWPDAGETPQRQIDLLKTFADQAVIAIENVRLFNIDQGGAGAADRDRAAVLEVIAIRSRTRRPCSTMPSSCPVREQRAGHRARARGRNGSRRTTARARRGRCSENLRSGVLARAYVKAPHPGGRTTFLPGVIDALDPSATGRSARSPSTWRSDPTAGARSPDGLGGSGASASMSTRSASPPPASRTRRSRCSRPSPTRPSSPSRTPACSARPREALERQTATAECCRSSTPRRASSSRCSAPSSSARRCLASADGGGLWIADGDMAHYSGGQHQMPADFLAAGGRPGQVPLAYLLGPRLDERPTCTCRTSPTAMPTGVGCPRSSSLASSPAGSAATWACRWSTTGAHVAASFAGARTVRPFSTAQIALAVVCRLRRSWRCAMPASSASGRRWAREQAGGGQRSQKRLPRDHEPRDP